MTDENEGFLARWNRRKHEARSAEPAPPRTDDVPAPAEPCADPPDQPATAQTGEADLSTLPPLDSLGPESDYTVFLRKGIPKALKAAALRKAWSTDPKIAAYRTPAEYDWDYNAPGYGLLRPTDDPKRMVEALFRHLRPTEAPAAEPDPAAPPADGTGRSEEPVLQADASPEPPPAGEEAPGEKG
ncbi:MAG TPA: DUF3306 domain-containing protein [Arenibaculum sp.]|nr:DUF3306 domain-containing protein [Arenibaculum sp.]